MRSRAYLTLSILFLGYVTENLLRSAASALSPILMEEFGLSYSEMGLILSAFFILYTFMQLVSGVLSETIGPRRAIIGFTLIAILGVSLIYLSRGFYSFFIAQMLLGFGFSIFYINSVKLLSSWFRDGATPIGILSAASGIGSSTAYIGFPIFISLLGSWRLLYLISLIILALCEVLYILLLGEGPYRVGGDSEGRLSTLLSGALNRRELYPIYVGYALMNFGWVFLSWLPKYLMENGGLTYLEAGFVSSIYTIAGIPGCILIPLISNRMRSRRQPLIGCSIIQLLLLIAIMEASLVSPSSLYALLAFLLGLSSSSWVLPFSMITEMMGRGSGVALGLLNFLGFLLFTIASPLYGYLIDLTGGYHASNLLVLSTLLLSILSFLLSTETYRSEGDDADQGAI